MQCIVRWSVFLFVVGSAKRERNEYEIESKIWKMVEQIIICKEQEAKGQMSTEKRFPHFLIGWNCTIPLSFNEYGFKWTREYSEKYIWCTNCTPVKPHTISYEQSISVRKFRIIESNQNEALILFITQLLKASSSFIWIPRKYSESKEDVQGHTKYVECKRN